MKCYNHSDIDAVGTCIQCGKAICRDCAVEINGRLRCRSCQYINPNMAQAPMKKRYKIRHFIYFLIGGFFALMIPVNLLLSLLFPPIFIQFVVCMVPMALLAAVFLAAALFKV